MDRIGAAFLGDADDLEDRQIRRDRPQTFTDLIGLVRLEAMQAQLVLFGIDRNSALAHLVARPKDTDRDLTPVRHEDFLEVGHAFLPDQYFELA